ncbi:MAG: DNA translocase FtsK 4TM domain-containing protein [Paludibacteraceae bacterium]|nr:DNA translocase FtsK 4TM domain-containing protein [Paludibacteraceae bacterium]
MAKRPSKARSSADESYIDSLNEPKSIGAYWGQVKSGVQTEQFRVICGILLALFTLYLGIAFVSFFFTGAEDFSILEMSRAERAANRLEIQNWMGLPGAALIFLLVHKGFGLASLALIALLAVYANRLFHVGRIRVWRFTCCAVFWLLYGAVVLGYIDYLIGEPLFFRLGGAFGAVVTLWAISYVKAIGLLFILLALGLIFFICVDETFVPKMHKLWQWLKGLFKKSEPGIPESTDNPEAQDTPTDDADTSAPIELVVTGKTEEDKPDEGSTLTVEIVGQEPDDYVEYQPAEDEPEPTDDDITEIEPVPDAAEESVGDDHTNLEIQKGKNVDIVEDSPEALLKKYGEYDPRKELEFYQFPSLDLLKVYPNETSPVIDQQEQQNNADRIVNALRNFGVEIDSIKATVGPTVTLYEVKPKAGVRVSKIESLESDIMLSLAAKGIRIISPMPGKGTVGIEVPNEKPQVVSMHSVIASRNFQEEKKMRLPIAIGRTITNDVFMFDLAKTPHLLVAGATGQGKSVAINAIITSLLYKKHPAELKMVLVDPKRVEFAPYKPLLKHYLAAMPDVDENQVVITDCDKVINTLNSLVIEMENRYKLLMDAGVRNLEDYNDKFVHRRLNPEKVVEGTLHHQYLPYIVIIIDEYGDFIMQAGKQVETPIARITQKARAVGMHMILATQRPSVNIVTGVIKANIPTRIALRTQSVVDSRTVLDAKGADQLIGRGDMLYAGNGEITRIQCAFVDTPEVDAIVEHVQGQQHYFEPYQLPEYIPEGTDAEALAPGSVDMKRLDPMFADVARYVVNKQEGSTSRLQRAFEIGYNRAGKLSDQLEAAGIVGPNKGSKGRDVLIQDPNQLEAKLQELGVG